MSAMIDRDIMTGREIHDAEQTEYIAILTEALCQVQTADTLLLDAQNAACRGDWGAVVKHLSDARHFTHYALSAVDLDAASQLTPPTATCPTCFGLRYYYPSGDPADPPEPCRCANPKE